MIIFNKSRSTKGDSTAKQNFKQDPMIALLELILTFIT